MIPQAVSQKFNEIRALIYCGSSQVQQSGLYIVTLDQNRNIDRQVALLTAHEAYEIIKCKVHHNPKSIELVDKHGLYVIRDRDVPARHFAFMLT